MTDALRDAELLDQRARGGAVRSPRRRAVALGELPTATRDRLSAQLFQVSDEIAAYDWDVTEVQPACCGG